MFNKNHFYHIHNLRSRDDIHSSRNLICFAVLTSLIVSGVSVDNLIPNVSAHSRHYRIVSVHYHHHHHRHISHNHYHRRHHRLHLNYNNSITLGNEYRNGVHRIKMNGKRIRHHLNRLHRRAHRSRERRAKRYAIKRDGNNSFAQRASRDIYHDINNFRRHHGLRALPIDTDIQKVADMRNNQVNYAYNNYNDYRNYPINHDNNNPSDNWIHGEDMHQTADEDAGYLGIQDNYGTAENAGNVYVRGVTHYENGHRNYNVHTPSSAAYANIDNMTNDDAYSDWGHRNNILDKDATGIGVASYYNPQKQYLTDVEDFSYGSNPKDI